LSESEGIGQSDVQRTGKFLQKCLDNEGRTILGVVKHICNFEMSRFISETYPNLKSKRNKFLTLFNRLQRK